MNLRDNYPNTKEEAQKFNVEWRDAKGLFKIFEPEDPTSLTSIEETINEVSEFLVKNGYDPIPNKNFVDNDFDYESPDEIVSLSKHGYIEAFVLFIEKEPINVVKICKKVLARLSVMCYERLDNERKENENTKLNKQLIFPVKNGGDDRISEQELRFLFVEEFKKAHLKLFYSVETPTQEKYKFGAKFEDIKVSKESDKGKGQSALLDMCVFEQDEENEEYNRVLNIEFKHQNAAKKNIAKDILKLMHEEQNGAFILLLKNTDSGTLCNSNERGKGVLNKFKESFEKFTDDWCDKDKSIQLVIISLEQNTLIYNKIKKDTNLDDIFDFDDKFGDIKEVKEANEWKSITI